MYKCLNQIKYINELNKFHTNKNDISHEQSNILKEETNERSHSSSKLGILFWSKKSH